jgi:OOP family OmpA-OmpF porin
VTDPAPRRRSTVPAAAWLLAALLVVCSAMAVVWGMSHMEDDILSRGQQALADAGLHDVTLVVEGRDAVLTGSVEPPQTAADAANVLRRVRGVRRVDAAGIAAAAGDSEPGADAAASAGALGLQLTVDGDRVLMVGSLPPDVRTASRHAAEGAFRGRAIEDRITPVPVEEEPPWMSELPTIVAAVEGLETGTLSVSVAGVSADGFVGSVVSAEAMTSALGSSTALPTSTRLSPIPPASISVAAGGDTLTLEGTLPSELAVADVVAAARADYETVDSSLAAGPVERPTWLEGITPVMEAANGWPDWELAIAGFVGTFGGTAPSTDELIRLRDGPLAALALEELTFEAEVEPAVVAAELTGALAGRTTFAPGSATLSDETVAVLDEAAIVLVANPSTRFVVAGHTDSEGDEEANLRLSDERARSVVEYLVAAGVAPDRLEARGFGESQPVADNGTAEGRAANRRIEFVVGQESG